jgi:AcrR family transcriptional regulator
MLDAAEALLVAEGAGALTTTRVAEAAGVSVGTLNRYLPDKEAIVEALADQ